MESIVESNADFSEWERVLRMQGSLRAFAMDSNE